LAFFVIYGTIGEETAVKGGGVAIRKKKGSSSTPVEPGVKESKQSVERFLALMDEAPIGICTIDFKGKTTYVNKRLEEVSGYSRNELLGKNGLKLGMFPKETVKILEKRLKSKLLGRPFPALETRFRCKDGHLIWVALEGKLMKEGSIPVGFQIIARDITQRKEAEEALRENRERLQKMFESVTDGISVVDLNGIIAEVNQRTVEMHGCKSRDDLLGKSAFALVAPRDHDRIAANMRKAVKQGTVRGVEYTLLRANGSEFPGELSTSILKDAAGKWVGHVTIARDITKRKKAEQALADEVTRRRLLVDQSIDGIVVLDEDAKVYEANRRFAEMLGYTPEEVRELHTWDWDKNFPPEKLLEMGRKVDEKGLHLETQHHRKDGSVIDVDISINGAMCGGQKLIFCVCRDITERKRAEEALKKAQEQLIRSEKLAAIGQLASGVGHELRNPLGAIKNAVLYVRRKVSNSELSTAEPKVLQFLDLVDEEVESANKVITDLLSFSRVAKPTVSLVSASSIIKDSLNHVAVPENIKVAMDVDPALPMVLVDASQIRQVFINVILNGLEAMPEGGQFGIKARSKDEVVTVDFTDTGCGIPESVMDKIFDPLFTTKPRGVGLGLAMSKSIMDRHSGEMEVKSKEGKGTTFTVSLPTRAV
jgi:two-component system cell cycle sensor histidine kinase PleC